MVAVEAAKLYAGSVPVPESGCWLWLRYATASGYGRMRAFGREDYAHRISWALHRGEIPPGLQILHKCDTPSCVNPDHLRLGTQADNVADMIAKGRDRSGVGNAAKTHCKRGHEYVAGNVMARNGRRHCLACHAINQRNHRARKH